jgi:hypothetical protein
VLVAVAGCESPPPAAIIDWYTTTDPLPTYQGVYRLDPVGAHEYVVVRVQLPWRDLWVQNDKGVRYKWDPTEFHLLTANEKDMPAKYGQVRDKFGTGAIFADEPTDVASLVGVAFEVLQADEKAGPMRIRYRDLAPLDLPADKRVGGE